MTSKTIQYEGILVHFTNENGKVYRVSETVNGNPMSKCYVFGIGKTPYVKAYNRRCNLDEAELALLAEVA